ncbi:hypothetical protein F5Y16DRAFT_403188 [Xylariaceae sp. FL0255]|nr:hypothetical protein F5Y16DRAFT_403188 [Xylariaceae sp. FL0255]
MSSRIQSKIDKVNLEIEKATQQIESERQEAATWGWRVIEAEDKRSRERYEKIVSAANKRKDDWQKYHEGMLAQRAKLIQKLDGNRGGVARSQDHASTSTQYSDHTTVDPYSTASASYPASLSYTAGPSSSVGPSTSATVSDTTTIRAYETFRKDFGDSGGILEYFENIDTIADELRIRRPTREEYTQAEVRQIERWAAASGNSFAASQLETYSDPTKGNYLRGR